MKRSILLLLYCSLISFHSFSQDLKAYNYLTFYYVDNSDGPDADPLNDNMAQELKDNLSKLSQRPDNYFFFFGCNGEESKIYNNLSAFIASPNLKKYLANASRESDFTYDKTKIREYFSEYPVKIKQNVEINVFLSTFAAQRLMREVEELPTPILFIKELPIYLNSTDPQSVRVRCNIFINKELIETKPEVENRIKSYFDFCIDEIGLSGYQTTIKYL